jgi:hypothetical protein
MSVWVNSLWATFMVINGKLYHTTIHGLRILKKLTPKGQSLVFSSFLKFGQAIADVIFVQKISNFRWTCGLVLASRRTNFYKILIFGLGIMPQKQNPCELRAARAANFYFILKLFWVGFFFINS